MLYGKYLFQDPPEDQDFPFAQISLTIQSGEFRLIGLFEQTTGKGPHPTVLLLHGFPGNEKNIDMSQALKRVGFNVLLFHYRGSWGSPGNYNFVNCIEDTKAAIEFLLDEKNAENLRVDRTKISIIGHSLGGFLGFQVINRYAEIVNFVAMSPVDFSVLAKDIPEDIDRQKKWSKWMDELILPLRGTQTMYLVYEMLENKEKWDLKTIISQLQNKNILILAGSRDVDIPPNDHFHPLIDLSLEFVEHKLLDTEHQYANCRIQLINTVYEWLSSRI